MIVDNYSDTEIFLKFLHQILEIDILKSDKSLFPTIWIEVGDGSDRQFSVVETDCIYWVLTQLIRLAVICR